MKYLVLLAALAVAGCSTIPAPLCTVTTRDGYGGTKDLLVVAERGHGTLKEYKVNDAYTGGWISDRTILSTTCNKD